MTLLLLPKLVVAVGEAEEKWEAPLPPPVRWMKRTTEATAAVATQEDAWPVAVVGAE